MDIEKGKESQVNDIEQIFNKIIEENFHTHRYTGSTENIKYTRSEKKIPTSCHSLNTKYT